MRWLALTLLLAGRAALGAAPSGAIGSDDCRFALQALERQEASAAAAPAVDAPARRQAIEQVRARRRDAARACLGGSGDPPPPTATALPPAAIAPARPLPRAAPSVVPVVPVPAVTLPPPRPPQVPTIVSCDAATCRTSDGAVLPRHGPNVIGPRGLCSTVPGAPC